jgi:hypothetical protein
VPRLPQWVKDGPILSQARSSISKLECKDIKKNADGSFSVTGVIRVKAEVKHNPIINVPRYTAQLEENKCAGQEDMR